MNNSEGLKSVSAIASGLPQWVSERILQQINQLTDYEPVIGIMGKTGAGKSYCAMPCLPRYHRSAMWRPVPVNLCAFACRLATAI
jgi:transcriptional regulator with AAA-type ATPase domain